MKMLQKGLKKSKAAVCLVFALIAVMCANGITAYAAGGTGGGNGGGSSSGRQVASVTDAKYAGDGTSENPYRIVVTGDEKGETTSYTAPNKFWGKNMPTVSNVVMVFERWDKDTAGTELISSMTFEKENLKKGKQPRMPLWTGFNTESGELRVGFAFRGDFLGDFKDWSFKFNAAGLTKNLADGKKILPGDTISLIYYGAYDENADQVKTYPVNYDLQDTKVSAVVSAVVDEDGYASFSGENMIQYGGNYKVAVTYRPVASLNVSNDGDNKITEKNGTLQMKAEVLPVGATETGVKWTIVDGQDKASIDENGLVTAIEDGEVTVRATSVENEEIYGECKVQISGQKETEPEVKPGTGTGNTSGTDKGGQKTVTQRSPKTGDNSDASNMWTMLILATAAGTITLAVRKRKYIAG